jgi:hypothetical protein
MSEPATVINFNDPTDKVFINPDKVVVVIKPSRLKGPEHMVAILLESGAVMRLPIDAYELYEDEFKWLVQIAGIKETE